LTNVEVTTSNLRARPVEAWSLLRAGELTAFFAIPLALDLLAVLLMIGGKNLVDFTIFRNAGSAVLSGDSPWHVFGFLYPAPAAVAFVPFAFLPYPLAAAIFCVIDVLAVLAILWILGVRDWRCYALATVVTPVGRALIIGTISPWIALAAALAWRYRDRAAVAGGAIAAALVLKIFLWPLLIWLVATRRIRAFVIAACASAITTVGSWLIVGPSTFGQFVHSMGSNTGEGTFSVFALFRSLDVPRLGAYGALGIGGLILIAAVFTLARSPGGDWPAFVLAIGAALALTPIMHVHYLVILLVVIAVARPRLAPLWTLPFAYSFVSRSASSDGSAPHILAVLVVTGVVLAVSTRAPRRGRLTESIAGADRT